MTDLALLVAERSQLLQLLYNDALAGNTTDSYSVDGQAVSRSRWRQWALEAILKLTELINIEDPYEIRTIIY